MDTFCLCSGGTVRSLYLRFIIGVQIFYCSFERWCIAIQNEFDTNEVLRPIPYADILTNLPPIDVMMVG
jgi:hypothetical protein